MKITDKMRLDFVTRKGAWMNGPIGKFTGWDVWEYEAGESHNGQTPRQAIDAAIRQERRKK